MGRTKLQPERYQGRFVDVFQRVKEHQRGKKWTPSVWACPLGCCGRAGLRKPALTQVEMEQSALRKAEAVMGPCLIRFTVNPGT